MESKFFAFVLMALGIGWLQPTVTKFALQIVPQTTFHQLSGTDATSPRYKAVSAVLTGGIVLIALFITLKILDALKLPHTSLS